MTKKSIIGLIVLVLLATIVVADNFDEAFAILKSNIPCNQLTDDQLEMLGDYSMEQMHPGELHEIMDERMGGEGSQQLRQVHINIAKMFYCGEASTMPISTMNMMMNRGGSTMMGYYSMPYGFGFGWFGFLLMIAFWVAVIVLFLWLLAKAIGLIHTPWYIEVIPYVAGFIALAAVVKEFEK